MTTKAPAVDTEDFTVRSIRSVMFMMFTMLVVVESPIGVPGLALYIHVNFALSWLPPLGTYLPDDATY